MIKDIHPRTPVRSLDRSFCQRDLQREFDMSLVSALAGMSPQFVRQVVGARQRRVSLAGVLQLLDQDAFSETFIPRSKIPEYLLSLPEAIVAEPLMPTGDVEVYEGSATSLLARLAPGSVQCVVTSTPYWGTRVYEDQFAVQWADGEFCPFGNEQTPDGFIRHTVELLFAMKPALAPSASVWWNLMDTYNTRTQIRRNASETLRAMRGEDARGWHDYECRRYSAGHSFLKDGEQCMIPARVAERAARIGYFVKSMITWKKNGSMPEPTESRVTRELEYITHLSIQRTPLFNRDEYRSLPEELGGRNSAFESEKITDVWCFRTSDGRDGHGAQFPVELPARCIALSSKPSDLVLDPFIGSGTTAVAARRLARRAIGFEVSPTYAALARDKIDRAVIKVRRVRAASSLPLLDSLQ